MIRDECLVLGDYQIFSSIIHTYETYMIVKLLYIKCNKRDYKNFNT